jgi:hypothetical protein
MTLGVGHIEYNLIGRQFIVADLLVDFDLEISQDGISFIRIE